MTELKPSLPETSSSPTLNARLCALFAGIALAIVGLDQITKAVVLARFQLGESVPVIDQFFALTYVRNTGAAFGMLATAPEGFRVPFFFVVPLVALLTILYLFRKMAAQDLKLLTALALVFGGALGNLIDRTRFGYVVDFLDFHWKHQRHFPAFNVADSAICIGVGLLMLDLALGAKEHNHASGSV